MMDTNTKTDNNKVEGSEKPYVLKTLPDGTIEITFNIPFSKISIEREKVIEELAKGVEIPGFRKGMAPKDKAMEKIPQATLIEHTLSHIVPTLLADVLKEKKLQIAIYPKFELIEAKEGQDWKVKALTAEMPVVELGDYKKLIEGEAKKDQIWTPEKGKEEQTQDAQQTQVQKEQKIFETLINNVKVTVPKIITDEEVNNRLSDLLQRIEKLGISLENYLQSVGKTAESLRAEYETQAEQAIKIDLILNEIALKEGIKVTDEEMGPTFNELSKANPNIPAETLENQKRTLRAIARKRKTLEKLTSLI